jgi:hypothetical protein
MSQGGKNLDDNAKTSRKVRRRTPKLRKHKDLRLVKKTAFHRSFFFGTG